MGESFVATNPRPRRAVGQAVLWLGWLSVLHWAAAEVGGDPARTAAAVGYPSRAADLDAWAGFRQPPPGYGEVAFYWWVGDRLDRERLRWQLDRLANHAVSGLQINYAHSDQGGRSYGLTYPSDPPLFSEAWWDLFRWFQGECRRRGMAASLSDYTLCAPGQGWWTDEIIRERPELHGAKLEQATQVVREGRELTWEVPERLLELRAVPTDPSRGGNGQGSLDLMPRLEGRRLRWTPPAGEWRVEAVFVRSVPASLDPMHPDSGAEYVRHFFQRFEDRSPGESGRGLNFFFSDELDLGVGGKLWNDRLAGEFRRRKGYDLLSELGALFADRGPRTPKVRLDYADVAVGLAEEGFFRPVFEWHRSRGMVFGCDHGGRGRDVVEFGDYFRTQRWMTGPGNDSPMLDADVVKNKVASSIAHLYERPRTWLEGFHSSGWGTTSAQVAEATFRNFVAGHNLLTLHGLYYTTHGGFWEWAPPCNHWRMPYWAHFAEFLRCSERLSYLLSQGTHRCDVAILYPVAAVEAGMEGEVAVRTAFEVGPELFRHGIDFDFVDFESLARATIRDGALQVAGEAYRVLVLPSMRAVRQSTLDQAVAFYRAGGVVVAVGALPEASDRTGREDPALDAAVMEVFGATRGLDPAEVGVGPEPKRNAAGGEGWRVASAAAALKVVDRLAGPDFEVRGSGGARQTGEVLHRRIGRRDVFMVRGVPRGTECWFRAEGRVELWDPWTGTRESLWATAREGGRTRVRLPREAYEAQLVVFDPEPEAPVLRAGELDAPELAARDGGGMVVRGYAARSGPMAVEVEAGGKRGRYRGEVAGVPAAIDLTGPWDFEVAPTLDNRWGDFRLPATPTLLGPEARRFRYAREAVESDAAASPGFDDRSWESMTCSFGPRFWRLGPMPVEAGTEELEKELATRTVVEASSTVRAGGRELGWEPLEFSWRWGAEGDPGHQGWHGLKGKVSDDFIGLGNRKRADREYVYEADARGRRHYLWSTVRSPEALTAGIRMGGLRPSGVWVNGRRVEAGATEVALRAGVNPVLLRYDDVGRGHVVFTRGGGEELAGARGPLAMRWHRQSMVLPYDLAPAATPVVGWYRFVAPPGLRAAEFPVEGRVLGAWAGGRPMRVDTAAPDADGVAVCRASMEAGLAEASVVALRIEHRPGVYGGAAIPEPVTLECGVGKLEAGDWSRVGVLESYSGGAWYRKRVQLEALPEHGRAWLDLGEVVSSAEVRINGQAAGVRVAPPWRFEISSRLHAGENLIEVMVCNTLANHYLTVPTRYRGELTSGLMGPVRLRFEVPVELARE